MQADSVDYGERRSGTRAEAGAYSLLSFARKCGQGIGGFLGGGVIAAFGYLSGAASQDAVAIQGIKVAAGFVPAVLRLCAAVVISVYPLTADAHRSIVAELDERRARRAIREATGAVAHFEPSGPVVTINEEYGAGGATVALRVAERLSVPYMRSRFTSEDFEDGDPAGTATFDVGTARFLRSLSRTGVDADASIAADAIADTDLVAQNTAEIVTRVRDGGVIVGRDGAAVLASVPGVLHVRLVGSVESRITRATRETGIDRALATDRLRREDQLRSAMSRRLMKYDPTDPRHYDLVFDTGRTGLEEVVKEIIAASKAKRRR